MDGVSDIPSQCDPATACPFRIAWTADVRRRDFTAFFCLVTCDVCILGLVPARDAAAFVAVRNKNSFCQIPPVTCALSNPASGKTSIVAVCNVKMAPPVSFSLGQTLGRLWHDVAPKGAARQMLLKSFERVLPNLLLQV